MNKKIKKYKNYEEWLSRELGDPALAIAYLNEALADDDPNVFLLALGDVVKAKQDDLTLIAKKSKMSRQNLYRIVSKRGNPQWKSLTSLFNTLGVQVNLSIKK